MLTSGRVHDWVNAGLGVSGLGIHCSRVLAKMDTSVCRCQLNSSLKRCFTSNGGVSSYFVHKNRIATSRWDCREGAPSIRREEMGERDMAYYFVDRFIVAPYTPESALEGSGVQPILKKSTADFIPNAFTPDGDDLNDTWQWSMPEGNTAELTIFNRTGHLIWSGQMASSGFSGWEASFQVARSEAGVYPWKAVVMDANGERMEKRRGFVAVVL